MGAHNNVHVPKESWPVWVWYIIEFAIVFAISALVTREIMSVFQEMGLDEQSQNWIFWSIVTAFFFGWYIIIRGIFLKRPILKNR